MTKFSLRFFVLLGIAFKSMVFANELSVEAYDEQRNNPAYQTLRIRISNNTQDSLHDVLLKYSLPFDSTRFLQVNRYYMGESHQRATLVLDTLNGAIILNIKIASMGPGVYPNQGGLSIGLNYTDNQDFKKKSSICYPDTNVFVITEKIPVFVEAHLALGMVNAQPMAIVDGSEVFLFPNQKVPIAWHPVTGAKKYKLSIYNRFDTSLVYEEITDWTSSKVDLNQGEYLWSVEAASNGFAYQEWIINNTNLIRTDVFEVDDSLVHPIADTHVPPLAARKDTPLLDLKWGELLDSMEWDRPHNTSAYIDSTDKQLKFSDPKHQKWDNSEGWRCWAVATIMMNHYYGGNATQDELSIYGNGSRKDSILHAFVHGESGGSAYTNWISETQNFESGNTNLTSRQLVNALQRGAPALICHKIHHCMVIDACSYYEHDGTLDTLCRFLNVDNDGTSAWMNWAHHSEGTQYAILKEGVVPSPRMADTLIIDPVTGAWRDSDGDGILDYDEVYRFKTDPYNKDSDGDSIEDKIEIWSYTRLEPYDAVKGVLAEKIANIDADSTRAERDTDSDNDGLEDGLEDLNHNGIVEDGETNPYYNEEKNQQMNVSDYFGLYALNQLQINDGAKCYEGSDTILAGYCNIAAAGSANVNHTVNVGSRAVVGNVYSRGDFFLRSYSVIDTLYLVNYVPDTIKIRSTGEIIQIYVQDGFERNMKLPYSDSLWKSNWPLFLPIDSFQTAPKAVVVKARDTLFLDSTDTFKLIRVESMGVLVINPGEYWVEELQIHSGGQLFFSQPGQPVILHVNGNVHWHPTIINVDYPMVAKGVKMIHHGSINMFIEGPFAGTIIAPESNLTLGQSVKSFYGSVFAKNITLHQHSKFYHIPYNPK